MNLQGLDATILLPAFAAGLLVLSTHVPLGQQVLRRGIIFIDLAVAQIAGLGVMLAHGLGWEESTLTVQVTAFSAALFGALALYLCERRWPEILEAVIGTAFILAATAAVLMLANNPHGGEHLKDLLAGQILWVEPRQLLPVAALYALILLVWFGFAAAQRPILFYLLFALAITVSVQLVGVYLVFASLIIPALSVRNARRHPLKSAYLLGAASYASGLAIAALLDLPAGAVIVWALAVLGAGSALLIGRRGVNNAG